MDTWVLQMGIFKILFINLIFINLVDVYFEHTGYPVITVERNLNDGTVNFSQVLIYSIFAICNG